MPGDDHHSSTLENHLDNILPVSLELDILRLHPGRESLLEKGRDTEPTLKADFEVKGPKASGAWRVPDAKAMTIWVEAGMTTGSGTLSLECSTDGIRARTVASAL